MTPIGIQMPLVQALSLRTFDCWTHEQDVREALDRPGNLDSPAAQVAIGWMRRRLPVLVARDAQVPIDRIVVVQVRGPVGFLTAVRVKRADDARPVGVVIDPSELSRPADTTLRLTTRSFVRRCCGRWTPERTGAEITGDQQIGRAVLAALSIAP